MKSRYAITVQLDYQPDDPHGVRRLRAALKTLLRRYGVQCVDAYRKLNREPNSEGDYSYPFSDDPDGLPVSLADAFEAEIARRESSDAPRLAPPDDAQPGFTGTLPTCTNLPTTAAPC
jgi:hypothetical protein